MSRLRKQLEAARIEYHAAHYRGDLATELLGDASPRKRWTGMRIQWLLPLAAGAMAAMVAIAVWHGHRHSGKLDFAQIHPVVGPTPPAATVPTGTKPDLRQVIANLPYQAYYSDMRSGMQEAVGQIAVGVDGALDAPLVTGTVATARHVAGDLQEVASATWSQVRPRKSPGC